ncbi:hypothetical protein NUW87_01775 [Corynebacterium pilbarense]|uniref:Phospholipase/carboxylesterase/thioesterase domain-containing protein n=1 Tax=Corynebacterium pilbarense TaxID=1288393 RepID=A0A9Q4NQM9_9CORY|nr:hypothetical protein [Corynebacterium pilbarense]MCZ2220103.1 hypothetical protein [Corynebacterium pilbarense]
MRQRTLDVGGVERSYHVSVPAGDAGALPVIVALHGKGDNGRDFLAGTGLHRARAIVAAPTGAGLAWSPAPYARTTFDEDAAFVRALIDDLRSTFATTNTYLVGFSNGGGLAVHLSLTDLDLAGVATVAAAVRATPDELAARAQPLDYLNIHGTFDDVVPFAGEQRSPYSGGEDDTTFGAPDVVAAFERRNGDRARAELIAVEGMGHEWPTGPWAARRGVDATKAIVEFFGLEFDRAS